MEALHTYETLEIPAIPVDTPEVTVEAAWALDVDRTLSSVEAMMQRLANLGELYGIPAQEVMEAFDARQLSDAIFDPLGLYKARLSEGAFEDLCNALHDPMLKPITYQDTSTFLQNLDQSPRVILTYAQQPPFQRIKVRSLPYRGYAHILEHTDKGPVIESWRDEHGTFAFVGIDEKGNPLIVCRAKRVNLVDDNGRSHQNLPPESNGYYIRRSNEQNPHASIGELPANVTIVKSLEELIPVARSSNTPLSEQPHAFIPLAEMQRPLIKIGSSVVSSLTQRELDASM